MVKFGIVVESEVQLKGKLEKVNFFRTSIERVKFIGLINT